MQQKSQRTEKLLCFYKVTASEANDKERIVATMVEIVNLLILLTFARLLWELFKALIHGVLDSLKSQIRTATIDLIKKEISMSITEFLDNALQLDNEYIENELLAEAIGAL